MASPTVRYLFDDYDQNRIFNYFERHISAGKHFPLHWHDYLELEIVISGEMRHVYNGQIYRLQAGDAHLICYHDFHELTALSDTTLACLHIRSEFLEPELAGYVNYNSYRCRFSDEEMAEICQRLQHIKAELNAPAPLQELAVKHAVSDLLIGMIRNTPPHENHHTPLPIQQLITCVNERFTEDITLEKIAAELSFSADHLGRLIKKQIGFTFNEYLNIVRLKHACRLLRHTALSVKEIAFACGYRSVEYFAYVFKKSLAIPPGEYRRTVAATAADAELGYAKTT